MNINQELKNNLQEGFSRVFGENTETSCYFAPGRVNLIGEHTDYNGGKVFPCALTLGTYAVMSKTTSGQIRMYSENFPETGIKVADWGDLEYKEEDNWANYPKSVIYKLKQEGYRIESGMDLYFWGNLPNQSGLSSSASIEVLTCYIMVETFKLKITKEKMSILCQEAENEYMGVNCGIMDQFAICMGQQNKGIFLDTNTLKFEYVPIELGEYQLIIAQTNKKRTLGESAYNQRRLECNLALNDLQQKRKLEYLCDLSKEELEQNKQFICNPISYQRALHVVSENERTNQAVEFLKEGKLEEFGKLLNESHCSLRDLYEVTGKELDTLVEAAWKQEGVLGARMTGAGFGGCTINLVKKSKVEDFIKNVDAEYTKGCGLKADFYVVEIGNGPQKIFV